MVFVGLLIIAGLLGMLVYNKIIKNERVAAKLIRERELDAEVVKDRVYDPVINQTVLDRVNMIRRTDGRQILTMEQAKTIIERRKLYSVDTIIASAPGGVREFVQTNENFLVYYTPDYAIVDESDPVLNHGINAAISEDRKKSRKTK